MIIQDVIPPTIDLYHQAARRIPYDVLIADLHRRGISIQEIFGVYYALEAQAAHESDVMFGSSEAGQHGSQLKVGDVELAGFTKLPTKPIERQPF